MQDTLAFTRPVAQVVPDFILQSPLMRQGGFAVYEGLLDERLQALLLSEATQQWSSVRLTEQTGTDTEEVRGGKPARQLYSAPGGPMQNAFYHAPWVLQHLCQVTNARVISSGERGTYSYYHGPGQYLALHRDVEACDLAVISCLQEGGPSELGGALRLYPTRYNEPLSHIRQHPHDGGYCVRLQVRQTLVLFGGVVPHEVLPMRDDAIRIVSVLCYRVLA